MDINLISRHFASIGAEILVDLSGRHHSRRFTSGSDYELNIQERKNGERFILSVRENMASRFEFLAVDKQPEQRHLLLMARHLDTGEKRKFLCGHDERHWFVAAVQGQGVTGVRQAMEALKPDAAVAEQLRTGVKPKNWHRRRNNGFIRQGEWFFLPTPEFAPENPRLILRNEPLRRGGGKPHTVQELYRIGGTTVYVSFYARNGMTEAEYQELIRRRPKAKGWNWRIMRRDPLVYVRGTVRHADHKTIELPFWHRVLLSSERNDTAVAFLD